jgi:preprotein translocase subunit SecD
MTNTDAFVTGNPSITLLYLDRRNLISRADVAKALPVKDGTQWAVEVHLRSSAHGDFERFTSQHVGSILGIVVNGRLCAYPYIKQPIADGRFLIPGAFTKNSAKKIALGMSAIH